MALVLGTNFGFVSSAPTGDPSGTAVFTDAYSVALKDVAPTGATAVTEIGWWCDNATEEANFEVGIYDHDAVNNRPGNLLAGASQTNAKGLTGGVWKVSTGLNISIIAGTTYWIAYQLDNTATATNIDYGVDATQLYKYHATSTFPNPWTSNSGFSRPLAVYAVYSSAANITVTPDAQSLSLSQQSAAENFDFVQQVASQSITSALSSPNENFDYSHSVSGLSLLLAQNNPSELFDYSYGLESLSLSLVQNNPSIGEEIFFPANPISISIGITNPIVSIASDFTRHYRSETFSLSWKPKIVSEKHHEIQMSENPNIQQSGEIPERIVRNKHNESSGPANDPLCPGMPSVKRAADNKLSKFLEDDTKRNVTRFRQTGNLRKIGFEGKFL